MGNGTSKVLNSEEDLDSIPTAQGGLSRLAIARLKSAGVPVAPLLMRVGLTPEAIADPEERLSVRSQVALLDEAAIALKDDRLGFTWLSISIRANSGCFITLWHLRRP